MIMLPVKRKFIFLLGRLMEIVCIWEMLVKRTMIYVQNNCFFDENYYKRLKNNGIIILHVDFVLDKKPTDLLHLKCFLAKCQVEKVFHAQIFRIYNLLA